MPSKYSCVGMRLHFIKSQRMYHVDSLIFFVFFKKTLLLDFVYTCAGSRLDAIDRSPAGRVALLLRILCVTCEL